MKVIFTGGGTGGHIYPALSLIEKIRQNCPNSEILFVGSDRGLEKRLTSELGIPFVSLDVQGLRRSLSLDNLKTGFKFLRALPQSKKLLQKFKPDIVVGTGGYVSAPLIFEAAKMKVKTIIFEPNSYPGLTNQWLGKKVDRVAIVNPEAANYFPASKIVRTGNPRSQEIYEASMQENSQENSLPKVLIFGGSLGALKINEITQQLISEYDFENFKLIFATGRRYYDSHRDVLKQLGQKENVDICPYIDQMTQLLPQISLIVSRSGATTIAEITALGVPAILIPSPNVTHDHQTYNAKSLSDVNASILLPENELSSPELYELINSLIQDPIRLKEMKEKSFELGQRDAADQFIKVMKELVDEKAKKE
ncbi:undecaprenyldiphospho-muramoylpentapeptide beta-N-acetylglucosaminyltransferase [Xylocopilactobacillus apicola]|uniref:UDP-N-acetylglucosamine--N-acetylmuramyl-(pentapeptide) pyrophosphoryl-undecaprenol N-acetylglucosamine transferase n=1 Tax=Xylocopilactobacillus apicola TaxID=2932184 RepID=A0AAU9DEJ8_9LACO|nr:undecaprenyldiphospho-muramoylpentapeptide beta-N-acetylglucosaminyltransferase [Xylocopilactobacillus apicola]BDR58305.1 UDP-N-acetylglucosamine--N-acetylmuramyl-(pentapeptide) pyrophosphoryl-undecaprenol N-acetylglucosamine transferase [Xylocopilactobacillus apicola]